MVSNDWMILSQRTELLDGGQPVDDTGNVIPEPPRDKLGLLAAIKASPDDLTPRLAYADWLDEKEGRETDRAKFIRAQCTISTKKPHRHSKKCHWYGLYGSVHQDPSKGSPDCPKCRWFSAQIFQRDIIQRLPKYDPVWGSVRYLSDYRERDLARLVVSETADVIVFFRCGFVNRIVCTAGKWLSIGDEVFKNNPVTEVVWTWVRGRDTEAVFGVYHSGKHGLLPDPSRIEGGLRLWKMADLIWKGIKFDYLGDKILELDPAWRPRSHYH